MSVKYKELGDKEWIHYHYVNKKLSLGDIATIIGCTKNAVREAAVRNGIVLRTAAETKKIRRDGGKSYCYELLNNKEWLYKKYIAEGLSTKKITKLSGAKTPNSVRQALQRAGIEVRSVSDGLTINREDDGFILRQDVIEGGLLGDASLRVWNKHSHNSYPAFSRKNKFLEHVEWVANALGCSNRVKPYTYKTFGKTRNAAIFRTLCHKELLPLYRAWYPESSGFKKVVPQDIEINKIVLLHWFLDDGYSYLVKRKYKNGWTQKKKQVIVGFCSESFTKEDQEMLCDKVMERFQLTPRLHKVKSGTGYRIILPQSESQKFFEIIGPPPVASLAYKWK